MEDLVELYEEQAKNFLINTQGVSEDRILIRYENSADVEAGKVIKTEPAKNEALPEEGPVYLYVSTGPSVKTVTMVDFTAGGYTQDSAEKWLELNGFKNVTILREESEEPEGKIFYQSVPAGRPVDVTTPIILRVSLGKNGTVTLPPDELPEPEDYVYKLIKIELPADMTEEYVLSLYREGVIVEERIIPVGTVSAEFRVSGKGVMTFMVLIDNEAYGSMDVDFDAAEDPSVPDDSGVSDEE